MGARGHVRHKSMDFTASGKGHETSVTGNPAFDQVELRRIDKKHAEVKEKKGGALVATVRTSSRPMATS